MPSGGHASSRVRCPHCREEFRLDEVLARLPRMLELLDEVGDVEERFDRFPAQGFPAQGSGIDQAAGFGGVLPQGGFTPTMLPGPRRRSRERNPLVEFGKIVGGGVAGLILAQMILFWVPGNFSSRQRDPLQIAPRIAEFVPGVVPKELRGDGEWNRSEQDAETLIDADSGRVIQPGTESRSVEPKRKEKSEKTGFGNFSRFDPEPSSDPEPSIEPEPISEPEPSSEPSASKRDDSNRAGAADAPIPEPAVDDPSGDLPGGRSLRKSEERD